MQFIPDERAKKTKDVADHGSNHDKCDRSERIEWLNEVNRLNHVRPENEIDDRLRPPDRNQERPEQVPAADQRADYQPNFVRTSHICHVDRMRLVGRFPVPRWARKSLGDCPKTRLKVRLNCVSD